MKKTLALTIVSSLALPAQALAADLAVEQAEIIVATFNWTGGYIGGQVGYAWGDGHAENAEGAYADPDPDGFIGGVYVGYNYQMPNNVVIGIDADATFGGVDGSGQAYRSVGIPQEDASFEQQLNWSGAVRARAGYAMDRFLPYIAGGVAFSDVDVNTYLKGGLVDSFGDTYVGWTIGAGVEYAFTDNIVGRFEYRYTDFGDQDFPAGSAPIGFNLDLETSDVRFGLAWKF